MSLSSYSTPLKNYNKSFSTPNKSRKTPRGRKTPSGDRFITTRDNHEGSQLAFRESKENYNNSELNPSSPSTHAYQQSLRDALDAPQVESKVLAYKQKAPAPREGHLNSNRVLYSQGQSSSSTTYRKSKVTRRIPQTANRILDAPELMDDYYLNLLSWSQSNNVLSVALGGAVYLWNAESGTIQNLLNLENETSHISSVEWIQEGNVLAVGTSDNEIQLWDAQECKYLRTMKGHNSRVGSLAWNKHILSSGSRAGEIHHSDVRIQQHLTHSNQSHSHEVCGLKWSADGNQLASGGNDNILNIWDVNRYDAPRFSISDHQAAVKALAWCPWQNNLLASGGGTADRTMRFWNTQTGVCQNVIDTKSQVCSILWNKQQKELISSHGFSQNQLCIWKYPSMNKISELTGHTSRVLHMAASPDGQTIVSAAGDETLRFWRCFADDSADKKPKTVKLTKPLPHHMIR
eukprot:Awhi_evm1s5918